MTEFCSTSIKHPMQYIEIENILKPELTNLINFFTAVTIPLDTENNNDTLNEKISRELMTYYYFFINQLFYKSQSIVNIAENQVVIIYQFDLNRALVIINRTLMANNFLLFANFFNNISINTLEISQNLENGIGRHNAINSENKINLSTFYTYKTSNDTLYEKKYNELTPDEKTSIHNDYIKNKGKNIQSIDSDGDKIKFTENSIK